MADMTYRRLSLSIAMCCLAVAAGCSDDSPTAPSPAAVATFAVGSETFRVALATTEQVAAARAAQNGGPARVPVGRVVRGTQVNTGWSWHLEDLTFAEVTIELCDGRPSDVEQGGVEFGGGRFCPWTAALLQIE